MPTLALVLLGPLLLGGVLGWTIVVLAVLSVIAVGASLAAAPEPIWEWTPLALWAGAAIALGVVVTVVQVTPLPCSVAAWMSPRAVEDAVATAQAMGAPPPDLCHLTRDPGSSRLALLSGVTVLLTFVASVQLSRSGRAALLIRTVIVSSLVVAGVALAHELIGLDRVYGLYEPAFSDPVVTSPLLNPNHLAAVVSAGAALSAAAAVTTKRPAFRALWAIAVAVCSATVLLTRSRGGVLGLLVGVALAVWMVTSRGRRAGTMGVAVAFALSLGLGLAGFGATELMLREVAEGGWSKLDLWWKSAQMALVSPPLGVGRGAFSAAFVGSRVEDGMLRYEYAENLPLHWMVETGLLVGPACLALLFAAWAGGFRAARRSEQRAALAAVAAWFVHDLADYSLQLTGLGVVFAALFGASLASTSRMAVGAVTQKPVWRRTPFWGVTLGGLVAVIVFGPVAVAGTVREKQVRFEKALRKAGPSPLRRELEIAMTQHPAEPTFTLLAGSAARRHRDSRAARLLNRSMEQAPRWAGPHLEAAAWLRDRGAPAQALVEVREAAERNPRVAGEWACPWLIRKPTDWTDDGLDIALPSGPRSVTFLESLADCENASPRVAATVDRAILALDPGHPAAGRRTVERLAEDDPAEAYRLATLAAEANPTDHEAWGLLARVALRSGRPIEAMSASAKASRSSPRDARPRWLRLEARAATAAGRPEAMRDAIGRLRRETPGDPKGLAATSALLGRLEQRLGNKGRALRAFESARRLSPTKGNTREAAASAARAGDRARGLALYRQLCPRPERGGRDCEARARLEGGRDE